MDVKKDILIELTSVFDKGSELFLTIHPEVASIQVIRGKWSISKEVDHLLLSGKPIVKLLSVGAENLKHLPFIAKEKESFNQLKKRYNSLLNTGKVNAPSRYRTDDEVSQPWEDQISSWKIMAHNLVTNLDVWSENDLDSVQVQHPVLGNLSAREILYFTIIHTEHHLASVKHKSRRASAL